jgi:hypothetical protein
VSVVLTALVTLLVLVGDPVCLVAADGPVGQSVEDTAITMLVKSKLVAARPANFGSIDVDTEQGVVHLQGTVPTAADRTEAEHLARGTNGVRQVLNDLRVEATASGDSEASASPATDGFRGRHTITGRVTDIDSHEGRVRLNTPDGELTLRFPPAALQGLHSGDTVTIELSLRPGA